MLGLQVSLMYFYRVVHCILTRIILVGILNEFFRAFVPAVLLGEAEPKANEQSAKPAENLAVISQACYFFFQTSNFRFIIISLLFHTSHLCSYLNLSQFFPSVCCVCGCT